MSALVPVAVAVAGGVGSAGRYLVDQAVTARHSRRFPWGIVVVNLTGSFALGLVVGLAARHLSDDVALVVGVGLLGGYTTFSTATVDTVRLLSDRRHLTAGLHGLGVLAACVGLAALGLALTA
ncbi:MAG: CrcB family protein [Aeromicrobium sp.]|uniref:fluoride efflux transporter FluC n=1 Tax=Aeromicrobium sp. TaxID=1871063 RepID=UPI0039E70B02